MTKPRRVHPLAIVIAFLLLIAMFGGMVFAALHHGTPVRFGLTPGAHAFGAARLLQYSSPQYKAVMYDDEATVLRALDNNLLDAALVCADHAQALDDSVYEIRGVFSVLELIALSSESTVLDVQSLSGRALILPESLQNTPEDLMLRQLLIDADAAGIEPIYARNPASAVAQHAGAVVLVKADDLAQALQLLPAFSARFRLSAAWRDTYYTVPPADYCIVARREIIGTSTFAAFEKHLRDSMLYADRKRKKTIAMAVASGIFDTEAQADQLIDFMSFTYHEGNDAQKSLQARNELTF